MIIVFGSINLDLVFPLPALPAPGQTILGAAMTLEPGGKGANQAVAAARDGARVLFAGAVGADPLADGALALLRDNGVDLTRVIRADVATGAAAICVDPAGRNQIAVAGGANLRGRQTQIEDAALTPATTVLLQMEVDSGETAALILRARAAGSRVILNLAPARPLDAEALRAVDLLVVNEDEAGWLAGQLGCAGTAAALHQALGVGVVVTLGAAGVEAAQGEARIRLPVPPVTAIDTTGAGDCSLGVMTAALDRGMTLADALRRANAAAAISVTRAGSQRSMPTAAETDAALRG